MKTKYNCTNCKKEFKRYVSTVRNPEAVFCSRKCKSDWQVGKLSGKNNPNYRHGKWVEGKKSICECGNEKDPRSSKCYNCNRCSFKKGSINIVAGTKSVVTDEVIKKIVTESKSFLEVSDKLNISRYWAVKRTKQLNLDISHFVKCVNRPYLPEEVFKEESKVSNSIVKKLLLDEKEEKCECCGLDNVWLEKPLTIELHHKNGINNDHRKENLILLCPNCHSQTDTHRGRNTITKRSQL
jgi:Zn finger protein HypA/HybF involved in hydrogenase expression